MTATRLSSTMVVLLGLAGVLVTSGACPDPSERAVDSLPVADGIRESAILDGEPAPNTSGVAGAVGELVILEAPCDNDIDCVLSCVTDPDCRVAFQSGEHVRPGWVLTTTHGFFERVGSGFDATEAIVHFQQESTDRNPGFAGPAYALDMGSLTPAGPLSALRPAPMMSVEEGGRDLSLVQIVSPPAYADSIPLVVEVNPRMALRPGSSELKYVGYGNNVTCGPENPDLDGDGLPDVLYGRYERTGPFSHDDYFIYPDGAVIGAGDSGGAAFLGNEVLGIHQACLAGGEDRSANLTHSEAGFYGSQFDDVRSWIDHVTGSTNLALSSPSWACGVWDPATDQWLVCGAEVDGDSATEHILPSAAPASRWTLVFGTDTALHGAVVQFGSTVADTPDDLSFAVEYCAGACTDWSRLDASSFVCTPDAQSRPRCSVTFPEGEIVARIVDLIPTTPLPTTHSLAEITIFGAL